MVGGRTTASRRRARGPRHGRHAAGAAEDRPLVVYGANAVQELLRADAPLTRLSLGSGSRAAEIAAAAKARGLTPAFVDDATLERLAGSPHHQGVVAEAPPFAYAPLECLLTPDRASALLLDGVQDPRNLGAVLRTARAAGVGGVVLPKDRSVGVTGVVVAASAGLAFGLAIVRVPNLVRAAEALKAAGFWLVGLVPQGGRSLFDFDPPPRPALVVGGEGEGLRPLVRQACDFLVTIPMAPGVESLNLAVATGIALYAVAPPGPGR
jgi:23S rRNA (guanosine2251-2'-O)-methyltransferase